MRPVEGAECDWMIRDSALCGGCGAGLERWPREIWDGEGGK